tara:strand:- start:2542 stop:3660 length:1119 start_codon:yes stop_codon:yes gene_type:complete
MRIVEILLFFTCGCFFTFLQAQKTVFSFDLPQKGDVFYYKLDNLPDKVNVDFQGARNAWNLSMLSAPTAHEYSFEAPVSSLYSNFFRNTDMVSYDQWKNEKFYRRIGNGLFLLGEVIKSNREQGNPIIKEYTDPKPIFSMEYALNVPQEYQSKWEVIINGSEIKKDGIDISAMYKISVDENVKEVVEDQGLIFLPREKYNEVIKLNRQISSDYKVSKSTGRGEWEDVYLSLDELPIEIKPNSQEITFLSENSKEWLAQIELDDEGKVSSALFKSDKSQIKSNSDYEESNFFLYPNPTFGLVRLDFVNLPKGTYNLDVYNIIGKKLWSEKYIIDGFTTIKADLGFLSKGTYLYSLSDKSGKKLLTRKMAIINP